MVKFVSRQKSGERIIRNDIAEMGAILLSDSPLIVNCTPVGMWPNVDDMPLWGIPIPGDAVVYDLIYNPPITRLMEEAARAGARVIGGLGMLVRQGALSFEQWTGIAPPIEVMAQAARARLGI